ncbi:uncharacterized protein [Maniola hyperantus]|uniref:uncharacterized protein isoform X2 n=1 Tax=Aphantopus hyperantus TaxID=2795564 RepID=UPI00213B2A09
MMAAPSPATTESSHQLNQKMERVNENDDDQIFKLMANYNIDKPIKISYVFEDGDSDETDIVENSKLPENPAQHASPQNKNTNSATELTNTMVSDYNCYSNVSFDDMENSFSVEHEMRNHAEENYNRSLQNQHTVNSYAMLNDYTSLRDIENKTDRMLNHNYLNNWASNDKTQYSNLLDTVSENVIMIAKYYHFYNIQYAENKDQNIRQCYLDRKSHYYHQSYSILVTVILPQEHNNVFIRDFINRTIEIAKRKSCHHNIYITSLRTIILDMIRWAKQRKENPEARINQSQYPMSRPPPPYSTPGVNTGQSINIQAPSSLGSSIPMLPSASCYTSNDTRQQIYGPSVSHVPLHVPVQPSLYSICNTNNTRRPMMGPPPISIPSSSASNSFSNMNIRHSKNTPPSVSLVPSDLPVPPLSSFSNSNSDTQQPRRIPPPGSLMASVQPEFQPTYTVSNTDTRQPMTSASGPALRVSSASNNITNCNSNQKTPADHDNTVCLFSTGLPGGEISISIDAAVAKVLNDVKSSKKTRKTLRNQPTKKRRKTNDIESPTLFSTSSTFMSPMQNQPLQNNYNCHSRNQPPITSNAGSVNTTMEPAINTNQFCHGERQNHKEYDNHESYPPLLSRSESRDSGFGSPILSTLLATNDYNNMVSPQYVDNQEVTPEITHVTSMNPDAVFIASGTCKICGSTTRNKCIACFKVYYCGTKCQAVDWPLHMHECKAR